jgi:hypothetical protein
MTGFKIVYDTYFFSFLVPLIFVFRVLPYRFSGRGKTGDTE